MKDEITVSEIKKHLKSSFDVILKDITGSTNTDAKNLALGGAREGTVVISKAQTAGRGRMNRKFFSPDDSGVYMSLVLRPETGGEKSLLITTAAAVSVSLSLDKIFGIDTKIKWVNDIYYNNKKVCGILAESVFAGDDSFCVLGIGINVYPPENGFPDDIRNKAGYLTQSFRGNLKNRIIAETLETFIGIYENIEAKEFLSIYRDKNMLSGKIVEVPSKGKAKVIDVDDEFHLVIEFEDKTTASLMTGEVIINL
ncbi:MAG: biotin--[acetyl-CoA-carboxylase] ligase [Clostridia bacterium]|nr:biotin--[acetyl-CoA-carboxylase] ligase [Clostridia bacterium]